MPNEDARIKELFDSRNSLDIRVALVENNTTVIAEHAKHISNKVDEFMRRVNDKPINNAAAIQDLIKCTADHTKFIYMLLGMGALITIVLVPIAVEVIPKLLNK